VKLPACNVSLVELLHSLLLLASPVTYVVPRLLLCPSTAADHEKRS
jgi:hypothetical protein